MKKLIALFLCICMLTTLMSATAFAAATGITVKSAAYHDNGDVESIDISFGWDSASARSRLTVMTERLRSAGESGTNNEYGDFTDLGYYGKQFKSWDEVVAKEDNFGILYYTDEQDINSSKLNSISLCFDKGDIPMNVDKTYFVYLWTSWGGYCYPDNLFMVLKVENGELKYASSKGRNNYGDFTVLKEGSLTTSGSSNTTGSSSTSGTSNTSGSTSTTGSSSQSNSTTTQKKTEVDLTAGGIFQRYIPISRVYGASPKLGGGNVEKGKSVSFDVGTRFRDESSYGAPDLKRNEYIGHYFKLNYIGTVGSIDRNLALTMRLLSDFAIKDFLDGKESEYAKKANLSLDTIVVSIDLYDRNKNFVRNISPASVIYVTRADGSFITYSNSKSNGAYILFTRDETLYEADDDFQIEQKSMKFAIENVMVADKTVAENLLSENYQVEEYKYIQYPELTGNKQYNTNTILSDQEFVTPDGTYYQVATESQKIDPMVKHEIKNVVSYSYYTHSTGVGYYDRLIVTADGTLYGVSNKCEKKTVATDVKKATANHYLTNGGEVKEYKSGKTIATDCVDIEESNDGWIIGMIKNDGSFYMGYSYIEGGDGYARGLEKKLDNAKGVVCNGVIDSNNTFYRFNNKVTAGPIDMNAFYSGKVVQQYTLELGLVKVCDNAERVFPYELLTKVLSQTGAAESSDEIRAQNIFGFVQEESGALYGFSTKHHEQLGTYGEIEMIFPTYEAVTAQEGTFVGIKVKYEDVPYAITCRYCDNNRYRWGRMITDSGEDCAPFVCATQNGYYGSDGKVYGTHPQSRKSDDNSVIVCEYNTITNFPNMHRATATYGAYNRTKEDKVELLPSVYTWRNNDHRITLLERTDGSVWMAAMISTNAAELLAQTKGYESSNAIQVSNATTNKVKPDFITVNNMSYPASTQPGKLRFVDVAEGIWYAAPVQWAVDKGITAGTSDTTFSPELTCTKAQILTFLWRAVGSPKMAIGNPFYDISATDYYYDAALWAYSKGMISGDAFEGSTPCTRSATVVYLWQNAGSPDAYYDGNFEDVYSGSEYAQAVAWAIDNNITSGMGDNTFAPDMTCTRGHIVTFLQRALK